MEPIVRDSKICRLASCAQVFYRQPGDRQWPRREYCCKKHQREDFNNTRRKQYAGRCRRDRVSEYIDEKEARRIWWGSRTVRLEPLLRRRWELTA